MSTQHPDNARAPFFAEGDVLEGEDEIQEAFYVYSHLGCDEQMWDFEGKEGDEYAVKKLLSRYDDFFDDRRLGTDARLTVRGPNPDVERSEAKVLLEILESVPRSYDAAATFAEEKGLETVAPIHEVIVPMVTDATQVGAVHDYYRRHVVGKGRDRVAGRRIDDWVGPFRPEQIDVIPLIEDRQHMLAAADIVREYVADRGIDDQRVFLARSDPALNYGSLSADLINLVALSRLADLEAETGLDVHPILGAGSAPFRGGLTPESTPAVIEAYPEVETFTVQSAYKYDNPVGEVREGIDQLRAAPTGGRTPAFDEERALEVVGRVAETYAGQVDAIAGLVNRVSEYVPSRRARKLHVGLFGYSREVGENALPRAIGYTAALYSVGLPPSLLGLAGLTGADRSFLEEVFPRFYELLAEAVRYYNPRCHELVPLEPAAVEPALDLVDVDPDPEHRAATDDVIEALGRGGRPGIEDAVEMAARQRGFLG
jgi:phosphoenolpyruvate carboxylase